MMCQYCGGYPFYYQPSPYQYSPYQYYGASYPQTMYAPPYYGLPYGYAYLQSPAPPIYYAPSPPRGEHRVGNCLMICQ